jgi:TPR repeat protein
MSTNGQGVPQSFEEEVMWFFKAADQGHEEANQGLEKLKLRQKGASSAGSSAHLPSTGCAFCGTSTAHRRCGRCKKLSYCTKKCQVAHRKSGRGVHELIVSVRADVQIKN